MQLIGVECCSRPFNLSDEAILDSVHRNADLTHASSAVQDSAFDNLSVRPWTLLIGMNELQIQSFGLVGLHSLSHLTIDHLLRHLAADDLLLPSFSPPQPRLQPASRIRTFRIFGSETTLPSEPAAAEMRC